MLNSKLSSTAGVLVLLVVVILGFTVGILIGSFAINTGSDNEGKQPIHADKDRTIKNAVERIVTDNLRTNLREIVKAPHIAGSKRDHEVAQYIHDKFVEYKLDSVEKVPYDVLLSYPDKDNPNKLHLRDKTTNAIVRSSIHKEQIYRPEDDHPDFVDAFNSYSPKGQAIGPIVYVNYATVEDFKLLAERGVSVKDAICLSRYGRVFRGNKVMNAYENGAKAILIYTDPADVAVEGTGEENVYPNSQWLPNSGMQRGSVLLGEGDPLTPYGPSIVGAYRITEKEANVPNILSQPLAYQDALELLKMLTGPQMNHEGWISGYNVGPGFKKEFEHLQPEIVINNKLEVRTIYNVIGKIYGAVEPDRYVIQGNHLDAWGFGAADPSSGTTAMLEAARILGELKEDGWRPRRTIMFAGWGAEEYGLIGSQEWVEENAPLLINRAVSYINVDTCVSGPSLELAASPIVQQAFIDSIKLIPSPRTSEGTLYDYWLSDKGVTTKAKNDLEIIHGVGSGSDHAPFSYFAGVSVTNIAFRMDKKYKVQNLYPTYHTSYDNIYWMETFIDRNYTGQKMCSQLLISSILSFSEPTLLPFKPTLLAKSIEDSFKYINTGSVKEQLVAHGIGLDYLEKAIANFKSVCQNFENTVLANVDLSDALKVRQINDQLILLEKHLLLPAGLPNEPAIRHVINAENKFDKYSAGVFPGVTELLHTLSKCSTDCSQLEEALKRHVSEIMTLIHQASKSLLVSTSS